MILTYLFIFILENSQHERCKLRCPKRPNYGVEGRKINLRANHLQIKIPSGHIYHYSINIQPEKCPRIVNREIVSTMINAYSNSIFVGLLPVFDGKSNMYTRKPIHSLGQGAIDIDVTLPGNRRERVFRVRIGWVSEISLDCLQMALEGHKKDIPMISINALDVVIRHLPSMRYTPVGRSLFSTPEGQCYPLGSGREVWSGYYQEVRPSQWKALLNIDTSSTAFYKSQPVLDFLGEVLKINSKEFKGPLKDADRVKFGKEIKNLKVEVTHCGQMRRKYRVCEVTRKPAQLQTFPLQLENGGVVECTVAKYFLEKYNIKLRYLFLPCLQVGQETKHTFLPLEVCNIVKGQRCIKKLTDIQTSTMIKKTSLNAPNRETEIKQIIRKAKINEDQYIKEFEIGVDDQLIKVDGRVLEAPILQYKTMQGIVNNVIPRRGKWDMINKQFYDGIEIKTWAIACFASKTIVCQESLKQFVQTFKRISSEAGMPILHDPFPCDYVQDSALLVERYFRYIKDTLPTIQLILVVLPGKTPIYAEVKRIGDTVLGIATQCVQARNVNRTGNQAQTISNIVLKVNVKLGGINSILLPEIKPEICKQPVIFLGASVAHPSAGDIRRPSIAAVVGSQDDLLSKYAATVRLQTHRLEIIKELSDMVKNLLLTYYKCSGGYKPHRIILFRDGVSESQFSNVLNDELLSIREACLSLEEKAKYRPGITFIVVQKRHHTRLFCRDKKDLMDRDNRSGNVPPGTTVDHGITHPTEFDFYLCSHQGIQGTSRPSHYHVLWDDNKFSADELQRITYQLCHTYVRCTRSVSIPAPSFYSHLVALRARYYLGQREADPGSEGSDVASFTSMERAVNVHEKTNDVMYFA